jgi:Antirepressor regulating drug resistance, predicted signal transduction N-terminal membrane component
MALIWSSIFIFVLSILRKSKNYIYTFGISPILFLCIGFVIRLLFPIELSGAIEVEFYGVIANINKLLLKEILILGRISTYKILALIWSAGTIILIIYKLIQHSIFIRQVKKLNNIITSQIFRCKNLIEKEIKNIKPKIICSPMIEVPMCTGLGKGIILLPNNKYKDDELYYILKHEYTHLKNRDIHIKVLIEFFITLFWWNPCVYLLRYNLNHMLEVRCDLAMVGNETFQKKAIYLNSLINAMKNSGQKQKCFSFVKAEFMNYVDKKKVMQRFKIVANYRNDSQKQKYFFSLFSIIFLAIWLSSYVFIIQPAYNPPFSEIVENDNIYEISSENAYIIKKNTGEYVLKDFSGEEIEIGIDDKEILKKNGFKIKEE